MGARDVPDVTLAEVHRTLQRIEAKIDETNGRVRMLELWRARVAGATAAMNWVPPIVTAVISGGLVAVIAQVLAT